MSGIFITFEGPDGAGKTTQLKMLGANLAKTGYDVVYTREPGGTAISEKIRTLLLDPANLEMTSRTELLLYAAARAQHVDELIRPALERGQIVLCDRFTDSTIAYQGYGRGIDLNLLEGLNKIAVNGAIPNLTIILDIDPGAGLHRIVEKRTAALGGTKDRIELEGIDFHTRVRQGFLALASQDSKRYKLVDAARDVEIIHYDILSYVKEVLARVNS